MKKFWIQVSALLIVAFAALSLTYNRKFVDNFTFLLCQSLGCTTSLSLESNQKTKVKILGKTSAGEEVIKALVLTEIADDQEERKMGLSKREFLASDSGMLFVFNEPQKYKFWMKSMRFPLDFLWIKDGVVVDILANVPIPPAGSTDQTLSIYQPVVPVDRVLEVNSSFSATHNITVGDKIEIERSN